MGYYTVGMSTWLLKTEPEEYSWETLLQEKKTAWTGVRNFEARNNIRLMKPGDLVFIYHSGEERIIMGLAKVAGEPYDDPTSTKGDWAAIDVEAMKPLVMPVSLEEIRNTYGLNTMQLIAQPRLSVTFMTDEQAKTILKIAKTNV